MIRNRLSTTCTSNYAIKEDIVIRKEDKHFQLIFLVINISINVYVCVCECNISINAYVES